MQGRLLAERMDSGINAGRMVDHIRAAGRKKLNFSSLIIICALAVDNGGINKYE